MPFTRPTWPGDARCAVTLTFENFGESHDLLRYGHAGDASADGVYAPGAGSNGSSTCSTGTSFGATSRARRDAVTGDVL